MRHLERRWSTYENIDLTFLFAKGYLFSDSMLFCIQASISVDFHPAARRRFIGLGNLPARIFAQSVEVARQVMNRTSVRRKIR